jgi:hypothetical protein
MKGSTVPSSSTSAPFAGHPKAITDSLAASDGLRESNVVASASAPALFP